MRNSAQKPSASQESINDQSTIRINELYDSLEIARPWERSEILAKIDAERRKIKTCDAKVRHSIFRPAVGFIATADGTVLVKDMNSRARKFTVKKGDRVDFLCTYVISGKAELILKPEPKERT